MSPCHVQIQHELKIVSLQQQLATTTSALSVEAAREKKRMFDAYGEVISALYDGASVKVKEVSDAVDDAVSRWRDLALFYGEVRSTLMCPGIL